jgi:hypothetical protein
VVNPSQTWPFSTNLLGLLANCLVAERMGCVQVKMNPVNKNMLCLWGKELLRCMGLPIRMGDPKEAITKCMVRNTNTMTLKNVCTIASCFLTITIMVFPTMTYPTVISQDSYLQALEDMDSGVEGAREAVLTAQ